ncbi:hypothetical protein FKP32DRAFT_977010 [Trametes sanguinea]|nr:hypothetical protein FKP32DRAFT_977010 [Trametes sanguinea]
MAYDVRRRLAHTLLAASVPTTHCRMGTRSSFWQSVRRRWQAYWARRVARTHAAAGSRRTTAAGGCAGRSITSLASADSYEGGDEDRERVAAKQGGLDRYRIRIIRSRSQSR